MRHLPAPVAGAAGVERADLAHCAVRRRVLPLILELGPAHIVATIVTIPQLRNEWPHLPLSPLLRQAWEDWYMALADDLGPEHPSIAATASALLKIHETTPGDRTAEVYP